LGDALGKVGCFGHVEVKSIILMENVLEIRQDLKRHTHLVFDVSIVNIRKRPGLRVLWKRTSP
jgi:hypothetical protein